MINSDGVEQYQKEIIYILKEQLLEISDSDSGIKLFPKICESDSKYSGPALMLAPDLIIDIYKSPGNALETIRRAYVDESV
jgi:hypothetical protein